jgi:hypothetical protein
MAEPTTHSYQVNDRLAIDTLEAGSGEPLLFLHGAGGLIGIRIWTRWPSAGG